MELNSYLTLLKLRKTRGNFASEANEAKETYESNGANFATGADDAYDGVNSKLHSQENLGKWARGVSKAIKIQHNPSQIFKNTALGTRAALLLALVTDRKSHV